MPSPTATATATIDTALPPHLSSGITPRVLPIAEIEGAVPGSDTAVDYRGVPMRDLVAALTGALPTEMPQGGSATARRRADACRSTVGRRILAGLIGRPRNEPHAA